jgi:CorA-like Mg2+ transporter protein
LCGRRTAGQRIDVYRRDKESNAAVRLYKKVSEVLRSTAVIKAWLFNAEADCESRLTLVAFIFIPLNFATSFFGMNVQQLGTGSINIGYFFLAAALVGGFAALLSSMVKPLERQLQRRREKIAADLGEDVEIIQKREIMRHSRYGKRLWTTVARPDEDAEYELKGPGPQFRKATKRSAINRWEKLTTSFGGSTRTGGQADTERQRQNDARADP